ncbi:putative pentatricopeptide repeat-containing protein At1g64310 [Glycine soja]|uniref:putative pentatricopeptide repeat-containing protein At1g64310 n=1 Tax=Glycine soja TaxID=3848 RepID=UPI00054A4AC0|nr:putative pentatricopeptide repeat-containing protein At1g64310 [Glycine soja]KHN30940.1 Putative pentatricopeptide repeat-containing protein [Glycine soja]
MLIPFDWLHSELSNICKSLLRAKQLHAFLLKTHLSQDPFYATKIVRLYAANNDIKSAHHVFDKTPNRSVYLWNSMIRAFAQSQRFLSAISLFRTMLGDDISPDDHTYACVIRACVDNFDFGMLRRVHGGAVAAGLEMDPICCSALVAAYSKLGRVQEARRVFDGIAEPDLVLWNSLISGYGGFGLWDVGMQMFSMMRLVGMKPDGYTLAGFLVGIADSGMLAETVAQQLFESSPADNVYSVMLSNIYAGDGRWDDVKKLRDKMTGGLRKMPGLSWIEGS